jgi:hypothetical protein
MAGLLDSINKQLGTPGQAPALGATQQVGGLLRAKLGKASTTGAVPAQSNVQEQLAQQDTQNQLKSVANVGAIQGEAMQQQAADQNLQASQQQAQHQETRAGLQDQFSRQTNQILDDLRNNRAQLNTSQQLAKMEQAGFMIRGMNDQYVNELKRQGQLGRLNNNVNFREAAAQDIMSDEMELFKNQMEFKQMFDMNDRAFNEQLSAMSDNFALKMGDIAAKEASSQMMFSGASSAVSAGLQYANTPAKPKPPTEGAV